MEYHALALRLLAQRKLLGIYNLAFLAFSLIAKRARELP